MHYIIHNTSQTAHSYTKPANVYAYLHAGNALFRLRKAYQAVGQETYIVQMAMNYVKQGMKYYLAIQDTFVEKRNNLNEIPDTLPLTGCWKLFRKMPGVYSVLTNFLYPLTQLLLKVKAEYYFRGFRLK